MIEDKIKVGSDFSGVGAFDQALLRLGIDHETIFACDMDKYARKTFMHNYGEPKYYPENVYDREIPKDSLDIYMTSPSCQAFSLAGNRKGEDDKRGILFYNSLEFIKKNNPRYFIFENVKGLLSDDNRKTFARWIDLLSGKSVNGNPVIFPHENSTPYHVYHKVLNAKNFGVPQNRERVFIIGIRDDVDNKFSFPKEFPLTKRLKDVLEENVDEKYFLSEKMIKGFISHSIKHKEKGTGFQWKPKEVHDIANCINARGSALGPTDNTIKIGFVNQDTQASKVYSENGVGQTLCAGTHGYANGYIKVKSATSKGYELAQAGEDSINFEHPNSNTRRGRVGVGVGVGQTLTTSCNQGVLVIGNLPGNHEQNSRVYNTEGISPTLTTMQGGGQEPKITQENCLIRKLTPRECFRLMDFPDTFDFSVVSDSQAYKQAGNSIVVNVLCEIIKKLSLTYK
ncbi:DNA (cytosine-5-)-methyltransferase [Chishuiella changwenlii]|uniref:DNA cytosine methyltransferase n=1 Tax=Chishuiella changwenlii TaxID=1434701 RepID=UPI002FDACBD9